MTDALSSAFAQAAVAASIAVDAVYGEIWTVQPMATSDPNARRSPDPGRAVLTVTAAYQSAYARASSGPARQQGVKNERPGHATERPRISFDMARCVVVDGAEPAALPYRLRDGDRVTRLKTGTTYQLAELRTDDTPRTEADLNVLTAGG